MGARRSCPRTLVVVGAGASGTEIASAYARLGSEVLLFEGLDRVLPTEDADISKVAERGFKKQGIEVHTAHVRRERRRRRTPASPSPTATRTARPTTSSSPPGRGPDVEGLGLDEAGVKLDERGLIEVDGALRTSSTNVYAIGDLVPGPALAHKASRRGRSSPSRTPPGMETHPIDYVDIPRATFCTPNVACFGLTEAAGQGRRPRRRRRQGPVRRRRRRHRLRRPHRPGQDRRRQRSTASCSAATSSARRRPS